jgi:hypothetical protein
VHFQHIFNRVTEPELEPVAVGCSVLDSHPGMVVCTMLLMKTRCERGDTLLSVGNMEWISREERTMVVEFSMVSAEVGTW